MNNPTDMLNELSLFAATADPDPVTRFNIAQAAYELGKQLQPNATDDNLRQRIAAAVSGGYDWADTLHNIYLDYGYPQSLDFFNYWNMYRRFGIAKNAVELPVDTCWMNTPEIEAPEAFMREFDKLVKQVRFWDRMKGLDKRQRVGRYAGLFMRVRDGKRPEQPIEGGLNGIGSLVQIVPMYEGQLKVLETDTDPMSDGYGMPTMYQFNGGGSGDRNERDANAFSIHPSRLVMTAEDADTGDIYGVSCLEAPYNSLLDLRKIIGGGGEGFYKNAAQSIVFDLTDPASAKANASILDKFNDHANDFMQNRARRSLWTPGMKANTLASNLMSPKEFFNTALNDVAAATKIPATILVGQQTGRLASSEDSRHFLSMANSRCENYLTEMVSDVLDWLMAYGVLPRADIEVEWDDLMALSDEQRLTNATNMATTNESQFKSGGEIPFSADEIREAAGYEKREDMDELSDETLPPELDDDGSED